MRNARVSPENFLRLLRYKPLKTMDSLDGITLIWFRKRNSWEPNIEFGLKRNSNGGQYFYYDMVNFGDGYVDGEMIPLKENDRRKDVILEYPKTMEDYERIADAVNSSLKRLYCRKNG